jgi:tetratricopeptide (TPR) repeat protein
MSQLKFEELSIPAADLGLENPLPPLSHGRELHQVEADDEIPADMLANISYGRLPNVLPYKIQDGYDRSLRIRNFRVAILENEILRAVFMLELGGRLWSLVHKPSGRELLYSNPVFQPGNLALRNAWFCGGVEWNIGTIGHSPFTCSPLFASYLHRQDGTPILRMYEWERIRQVPFQIDVCLPDDSPVLLVMIRIINPHQHETPMYWWSNMAVPESENTRVLVPASKAFRFGYKGSGLLLIPTPEYEGIDYTYTTNLDHAADFFFNIKQEQQPWICALDGTGSGLIQTSTPKLRGRKLFLWGIGTGGRKWQHFLSPHGGKYLEIQAGLARTQMEHLPMPGGAEWIWQEAYGRISADPEIVHGVNWQSATGAVSVALETMYPQTNLLNEFQKNQASKDFKPEEIHHFGSGWGALEEFRRKHDGEASMCPPGIVFDPASLGVEQEIWLDLLNGEMNENASDSAPASFMVQVDWKKKLEGALVDSDRLSASGYLHLGIMRSYMGEEESAKAAWKQSLMINPSTWVLRNLGLTAWQEKEFDQAVVYYLQACKIAPDVLPILVEFGKLLLEVDRPQEWLDLLPQISEYLRENGRIRLLEARAALMVNQFSTVEKFFKQQVIIPDIREGEISLSDLWIDYHSKRISIDEGLPINDELRHRVMLEFPIPVDFDFRMSF